LRNDFFKTARDSFDKNISRTESNMKDSTSLMNKDMTTMFNTKDTNLIKLVDDDQKLEISLDTAGYKPDELKVTAGQGVITVEGKHEEKSQAGQVMVARQFSRSYGLPRGARPEEVVSNLSQDGVLLISVPKAKPAIKDDRKSVPIDVK